MRLPAHFLRRHRRDPLAAIPPGRVYTLARDFVWGAATASHQVEGMDTGSDWWRYERQEGTVQSFASHSVHAQDYKSDHWRLFSEDIKRMKETLGLTGYRFSIDWSRVEPREGQFDGAVIARYAEICSELRAAGIRPCVTLFHWSSPDWIWDHSDETRSGWYDPRIVGRFTRFCEAVVPALAPHTDLFCTLNEPNVFLYGAYSEGILAPGHRRGDEELFPILGHLLECHANAYRIVKAATPNAQVGVAQHFHVFEPESRYSPLEAAIAAQVEQAFSWLVPDAIASGEIVMRTRSRRLLCRSVPGLRGTADFVGVNYYERVFVRVPRASRPLAFEVLHDHRTSKEIWPRELYSAGFLDVLETAHRRYGLPIYVTENGRAHPDDRERERFLVEHLRTLAYAKQERGVDVRGYFYWSLLDNQEWANGFLPRLGLYEVNYDTGERRLRGTGQTYARIIREGMIRT
jgi:beta-glucosidase